MSAKVNVLDVKSLRKLSQNSQKSVQLFAIAVFLLFSVLILDFYIFFTEPYVQIQGASEGLVYYMKVLLNAILVEGVPRTGNIYFLKSALICMSSLLLVIAIGRKNEYKIKSIFIKVPSILFLGDKPAKSIEAFQKTFLSKDTPIFHSTSLFVLLPLLLNLGFLGLFMVNPKLFYELVREDQIIENLSAIFYFVALIGFVYVLFQITKSKALSYKAFFLLFASFMAFGFFIMGMEEISWFQRVLDVETPEMFVGNAQNEMNFHNFATDKLESVYYFLSFCFLILLPFINDKTQLFPKTSIFSFFIPSRLILLSSIIFVVYTYDKWNGTLGQLSFFISFFILMFYSWEYRNQPVKTSFLALIAGVFLFTQIIFLSFGENFIRTWDVTEYMEFFIPIAFTLYAIEMILKTRNIRNDKYVKAS